MRPPSPAMASPTIVVGTDFSEGSRRAVQAVSFLAHGAPARIRLVHSFPPGKPRLSGAELRRLKASIARAETQEATKLTAIGERLRRQGFEVETIAVEGKAAATLLSQAKRAKAGLIAIGTAGRRGIGSVFLGSVAQAVLRDSPVPVLVTPSRRRRGRRRRAGPVLAAIDLGPTSSSVLEAAADLANDLGVSLHVLHTISLPFVGVPMADSGIMLTPEILAQDEESAALRVTELLEPIRARVKADVTLGLGDPATHVLNEAVHLGAAAIVVGRRKAGRRLGSVSAGVVHGADRPVLMVPAGFGSRPAMTLGFARAGG
jgi:nucleotide-binding universal stress UspA family protein